MTDFHKEFNTILRELSFPSQWQMDVFRDFLIMSHISIANTYYKDEKMEKNYLDVSKKYNAKQLEKFAKLLTITILALNNKHQDFLGESFMQNNMGNSYRGQFFTPFNISIFMAKVTLGNSNDIKAAIKTKGFFSLCEPACGSGGMVIACDKVITDAKLKSSEIMWVQAQDIDSLCFMMSFIQLSILDIPARVVLGDTLAMTEDKVLYTPAFARDDWFSKIDNTKKEPANNPQYCQEQLEKFKQGFLF